MPITTTTTPGSRKATKAKRGTDAYLAAYFDLCNRFAPAPIRIKAELRRAAAVVDDLSIRGEDDLAPAEADYLEVVSDLIEDYERATLPDPIAAAGDGIDLLKSFLDDHHMTASDLGRLLGNRSLGSKLLRRQRRLSQRHMHILGQHFAVSPGLFLLASPTRPNE